MYLSTMIINNIFLDINTIISKLGINNISKKYLYSVSFIPKYNKKCIINSFFFFINVCLNNTTHKEQI
jgi:hypothetical protein